MKKQPKLHLVESPDQWGYGLAQFKVRHDLSWQDLVTICDHQTNDRTLRRLCSGVDIRFTRTLRPAIRDSIQAFLESKNYPTARIEKELRSIFCKEEIGPMITQRTVLRRDAQTFFGLRIDPFTGDPKSLNEVFTTPKLDSITGQLEDAVLYQGFLAVIGEVGSGKSLLKRRVVQKCADSRGRLEILWPQFFNMDQIHSGSITAFLLRKFEQRVPQDKVNRAEKLRQYLASLADEGVRVALGFDECHRLHPSMLTALKNFWELGSGGFDRYLGLILFGQPRFEMMLRNPEFREIAERLDIVKLPDLSRQDDAWKYICQRVKIAGGNAEKLFDKDCIVRLAEVAPTPLALGNLANAALLKAHELNERKVHKGVLTAAGLIQNGDPRVRGVRRSV